MVFEDLRAYIDNLERSDDLLRIKKEVDWNLEIGAIIRRCNETKGPATLFEKIKDYPQGYRAMGGPIATFRRLAIVLGLNPSSNYKEILETFIEKRKGRIKPIIVNDGPCKENVITGNEIDLFRLPAPYIHMGDGGRYLGTWVTDATKDPDSDWVNWGMYRLMIHDRYSTGVSISPHQHIGIIHSRYEGKGKPMEFAAFIGSDPSIDLVGASALPYGVSEADVAGAIRGEPLKLIKAETSDLLVPGTSEIIIEGIIPPWERKGEGPHGEYAGYQQSGIVDRPVLHVKAITHRNNPIMAISNIGVPVDDSHITTGIGMAANFTEDLSRLGMPIKGVFVPPEASTHLCVVSTETPYPYIATRIANAIWACKDGFGITRIIVVNNDVDPTNMDEVLHAFTTKCHPVKGTITIPRLPSYPLIGFLDPQERTLGFGKGVLYDATWPLDWPPDKIPPRSSFKDIYPEEVQEKVLKNWKEYGF